MRFCVKLPTIIGLFMIYFYILVIIQVVAESLPVSSSTHLILFEKSMALLEQYQEQTQGLSRACARYSMFDQCRAYAFTMHGRYSWFMSQYRPYLPAIDHMLHGLTALIVAFYFRSQWLLLVKKRRQWWPIISKLVFVTAGADSITACFFLLFRAYPVKWFLWYGLIITALLLYSLRWCKIGGSRSCDRVSMVVLGCVQGIALLPGVSRFAMVYVVSRWLGFSERNALAVTWMIFWPLMVAASAYGTYSLITRQVLSSFLTAQTIAVVVGALLSGYGAFCGAACMIYSHTLWRLSWYVVLIACITLFL